MADTHYKRRRSQITNMTTYAALIGLDWGNQNHAIALQVQDSPHIEKLILPHSAETLQEWIQSLRGRFGGRPVALALETTHGPVIHALLEHEFVTVYPINPQTSAYYRRAFTPSGAKDDVPDAEILLYLLSQHRDKLMAWNPDLQNDLRDSVCISRTWTALANLLRRTGRTEEAVRIETQRTDLWKHWNAKLPNAQFLLRQSLSQITPGSASPRGSRH